MIIKDNPESILSYLEDSSNFKEGKAEKVFIPEEEKEIIEIVKYCSSKKIPLTISGGGTGTVGGRIPKEGFVISTEKLDKIKNIDIENKVAILESGVVIDNFLKILDKESLFYPPFPTERSAFIGGNVSTNASGEYSFKFGATRKYIKKIRMILSNGKILEIERGKCFEKNGIIEIEDLRIPIPSYRTPQIKCSAGYYSFPGMDFIDLIIGSEGTLGIITQIEVRLIEKLPDRFIMVMFFNSDERILELLKLIKQKKELEVYTLEYFDKESLFFLKKDFPEIPGNSSAIYVEGVSNKEKIEIWMDIIEEFKVKDTWVGEDEKNYKRLIDFRHKLPENVNSYFKKIGSVKMAVDVSVPEENFPSLYNFYKEIMKKETIRMILFGHIGENHLHFNFFPKDEQEKIKTLEIYKSCIEKGIHLNGTVSAEHGIGKLKHKWLRMMYGEKGIREMAIIKKFFDPFCILGLDNIFPKEVLSEI